MASAATRKAEGSAAGSGQSDGRWRARWRRLVERVDSYVALPSDADDVRVRKVAITLLSGLIVVLATAWVATYAALGLWLSAAIPFSYQVLSLAGVIFVSRTKRFDLFLTSQLILMLILPFLLQWSLGGFRASSAVFVWALAAPMAALVFLGPRRAWPWFAAYMALLALSTVLEVTVSDPAGVPQGVIVAFFFLNITGVSVVTYVVLSYFVQGRERALDALDRQHRLLQNERAKSEHLLLNVLPAPIADRLKEREEVIADAFPDVSVLFADIVAFTPFTQRVAADQTVAMLNALFTDFDRLAEQRGLEKIKTIGDAYMLAGGLPEPHPHHDVAVAEMALEMIRVAARRVLSDGDSVRLRVGIDSGPVVAGVIGKRKFIYDLWGDTVNTASRMESHGLPDHIQVTERFRRRLEGRYEFQERGTIEVKGKGRMRTHFLIGRRPAPEA